MIAPHDVKEVIVKPGEVVLPNEEDDEYPSDTESTALNHLDDCFELLKELKKRKTINPFFKKAIEKQADALEYFLFTEEAED